MSPSEQLQGTRRVPVGLAAQLQNHGSAFHSVCQWFQENRSSWPHPDDRSPVRQTDRTPHRRSRQLTAEQSSELLQRYQAGERVRDLAVHFDIHRTTVKRHLDRHGVNSRFRGMTDGQIVLAINLYVAGKSLRTIATTLHVNDLTVRKRLAEAGITIRKKGF